MSAPTELALPVLIGEAPSLSGDRYHMFPLSGAVARTLCQLAEIPPVDGGSKYGRWTWALYDRFECRNVFGRHRDATPWSAPAARSRLEAVLDELAGRVVVCLGRRPLKALYDALDVGEPSDFFQWSFLAAGKTTIEVAGIPHPSALNRALHQSVEEQTRCRETLQRALAAVTSEP